MSVFLPLIKLQMQFTTHVGDDLAKPVFKKGAAFVFKYQAVTSESESKARNFSPFPRIPAINLTQARYMVEAFKRAPDSIVVMYINENCKYMYFNETYALLLQQLETRVSFLEYELTAALEEKKSLFDVAISFIPPGARRDQQPGGRSRRAIGAIAAVAAGAGLVQGEPIKNAACNALSIFNLCKNNDALSRDVDNIMRTQDAIVKNLERVQTRNDKNFFLLGKEIKRTQESVRTLKEVVDVRFKHMEFYLVNATLFLARTSLACDHVIVRHMHLLQPIRHYVYQMGTLYTHLKAYRAAFLPTTFHSSQQSRR